jgi:hypothetical protein
MSGSVAIPVIVIVILGLFIVGAALIKGNQKGIGTICIVVGAFLLLGTTLGHQLLAAISGAINGWQSAK